MTIYFIKRQDWIDMLIVEVGWLGPGNSVLDGSPDFPKKWRGKFWREMGQCNVTYRKNVSV